MRKSNTSKQIKIGAILSYGQMEISVVITLLYTPLMIRFLGDSEYGLYNTVISMISMLSVLSLGFNSCYIRYYSKYKEKSEQQKIYQLNGLFLLIFIVIALVALACGLFLTFNLHLVFKDGLTDLEYPIAKKLMFLLTLNLAVSFPMSVFANIISAHEKFIFLKLLTIFKTVFSPLLTIPLLLNGFGSVAIVWVTIIVSLIVDLAYVLFVTVILKQKFIFHSFEKGLFKSLFVFAFFIAVHIVVDQLNWNVDKMVLARYKGTVEVAIYSVGFSLYTHYLSMGAPISGLFAPRVNSIVENGESEEAKNASLTQLFIKLGRIQWLLLGLICTGYIFFGKIFIEFWVGQGYESAYYVGLLLIIPGSIDLIQNLGIEIQRAKNLHGFRAAIYLIMAIINVIVSIFLCQKYGAIGAAIGTAISLVVVQGIIINIYLFKKCGINVLSFWGSIIRLSLGLVPPVVVGLIIIRFININSILVLIACVALYTMVYCGSMWLIGMNNYEKDLVKKPLFKILKRKGNK